MDIPYLSGDYLESVTSFTDLVAALQAAFAEDRIRVPMRHHHEIGGHGQGTMLLMPAWDDEESMGVKLVNVFPGNVEIPTINGLYIHFSRKTGQPLCIIDAKSLTNKRTAAASALASSFLSRKDAHTLLVAGTGSLIPDLIRAHCAVRPISRIFIWGRNHVKAHRLSTLMSGEGYQVQPVPDLDKAIPQADIISCATMANAPIVHGKLVVPGTHVDLVGSYKPEMREGDDELLRRSKIFVDTVEGATTESGDLCIPLREKVITPDDISCGLDDLCSGKVTGRKAKEEITLFKSVGYALEDLVAGNYYYDIYLNSRSRA